MRGKALLFISLGVNVLLATMIYRLARENAAMDSTATLASSIPRLSQKTIKTNVVVRRLPIQWNDLESTDFKTYIKNLRSIGCPEPTIRDIIVAEVNELFKQRQSTEVITSEQQWWRLEPDMDLIQAAFSKHKQLETEKELLLTELLGSNWKTPTETPPMPDARRLDGPVLGKLSRETRDAVAAVEQRAQERAQAYQESLRGSQPDPAQHARLRDQTRQELATILNPEQLEEYLLRYSNTASNLRVAVNGLNLGPEEFRKLFRAIDPYQRELELLPGGDAATQKRQAALEEMKTAAIRQALGGEQYTAFALNQNPVYQQAKAEVEQHGAAVENVLPVFQIHSLAQAEMERINNDPALSEEDRKRAIENVISQKQQSIKQLLGSGTQGPN